MKNEYYPPGGIDIQWLLMGYCKECKLWVPDAFHMSLGTCEKRDRPTLDCEGGCEFYSEKIIKDFMWCEDCRTIVHRSELQRHKGHCIFSEVRTDPDSSDYLPAGD